MSRCELSMVKGDIAKIIFDKILLHLGKSSVKGIMFSEYLPNLYVFVNFRYGTFW